MDKAADTKALAIGRPWRRATGWLVALTVFFYLTYGVSNWLASQRGDVPAIQDVSNGTLDITWASPTSAKPQIDAGRVRPLAVAGSKRSASMPLLPTFAEQLVAGFDLSLFVAAYAPAGTPAEIVDRMSREIKAVIGEPAVAEKMIAQGQTPVGSTPKELADVLSRETPIWAELIRQSGAKVE